MRKWHPHFTRAPLAPITALAQVKCREHARPCQTRVISRSEKKSRRSVGNIREIVQLQRCDDAACASGISTLYTRPPCSNYSPGAGKVQRACAAMRQTRVVLLYCVLYNLALGAIQDNSRAQRKAQHYRSCIIGVKSGCVTQTRAALSPETHLIS